MRRRHHREHAAFEYRKPTYVRKPEADIGEDSRNPAARWGGRCPVAFQRRPRASTIRREMDPASIDAGKIRATNARKRMLGNRVSGEPILVEHLGGSTCDVRVSVSSAGQ